jgi:branched-chain amino acid transport system substrate-binding protein
VIVKDDQSKPDLGRTMLAEAYGDDKVDIAVGTSSSGSAIAMLPVAAEYKKVLIIEPAVADAITGEKWNRYIFRTARNSAQDGLAAATTIKSGSIGFLAQDYAFGKEAVKASKEALVAVKSSAKVVHEEYAPQTATDFTASAQRLFNALKDKPQPRVLAIAWAGPNPMNKIADMKPERYGISVLPGGNILPVLKTWKAYAGTEGTIYYYYGFPKNKMNDWLVAEHMKRFKSPPDMFTAGGFAAASAVVTALQKAGSTETEKLISTMEGMEFETPKGKMSFRKQDHQAMQPMYHFRIKKDQKSEWDLLELVREIPAAELPVPVKNKR